MALDDLSRRLDIGHIIFFALQILTRALTVPNVVFETGFELAGLNIFRAEVVLARARRIHLADEFEHGLHGLYRRIRSIVLTAIAREVPQAVYAREALLSNGDVRIALVVLEVDVVARLMLFDEVVFQQ